MGNFPYLWSLRRSGEQIYARLFNYRKNAYFFSLESGMVIYSEFFIKVKIFILEWSFNNKMKANGLLFSIFIDKDKLSWGGWMQHAI